MVAVRKHPGAKPGEAANFQKLKTDGRELRETTGSTAVNFARVPKKRPKLCAKTIRERDGNRCQYTGKVLRPDEGSLDHVLPRSRGGKDEQIISRLRSRPVSRVQFLEKRLLRPITYPGTLTKLREVKSGLDQNN